MAGRQQGLDEGGASYEPCPGNCHARARWPRPTTWGQCWEHLAVMDNTCKAKGGQRRQFAELARLPVLARLGASRRQRSCAGRVTRRTVGRGLRAGRIAETAVCAGCRAVSRGLPRPWRWCGSLVTGGGVWVRASRHGVQTERRRRAATPSLTGRGRERLTGPASGTAFKRSSGGGPRVHETATAATAEERRCEVPSVGPTNGAREKSRTALTRFWRCLRWLDNVLVFSPLSPHDKYVATSSFCLRGRLL